MHAHPYFSLLYIIDCDDFPSRLGDCEIRFKKNQLCLQPPNTLHTPTDQYTGSKSAIAIRFNLNDANLITQIGHEPSVIICDTILKLGEFENEILSQNELNSKTFELLTMFLNSPSRRIIAAENTKDSTADFIKLIKYMYTNYDQNIALTDMAKIMHMEPTYFAKRFKALYNITPKNYLYSVRLFRSLDILMYTNISIASIAEKVGFKNVSAFCTSFRRAYNLSPGEYRKQAQQRKFDIML